MIEKLVTHRDFLDKSASQAVNEIKSKFFSNTNFFDNVKYLIDLNDEELQAFNLFKEKCLQDLRSRNKSSANSNHERAQFFNDKSIYHHHLIDLLTYQNPTGIKEKRGKGNTIKKETFIVSKEIKTISDNIEKNYHTSGLCLHYQKIVKDVNIFYKILFISVHPVGKEWTETKNFIENNNLHFNQL